MERIVVVAPKVSTKEILAACCSSGARTKVGAAPET